MRGYSYILNNPPRFSTLNTRPKDRAKEETRFKREEVALVKSIPATTCVERHNYVSCALGTLESAFGYFACPEDGLSVHKLPSVRLRGALKRWRWFCVFTRLSSRANCTNTDAILLPSLFIGTLHVFKYTQCVLNTILSLQFCKIFEFKKLIKSCFRQLRF